MQSASSNFSVAASAGGRIAAPDQLYADWAQDGYGVSGSTDDLSQQFGTWTVTHCLDDGLPSDVHEPTIGGGAFGTLSATMTGRAGRYDQGGPETAARYFSQFNTNSPVASYDRDVAPTKLQAGFITASGPEYVTLFTGRMSDLPVTSRTASMTAASATSRKLQMLVQPPAVDGTANGLTASWPVSYTLHKCGLYTSPPHRTSGCRWWQPMHGSLAPMVPDRTLNNPTGLSPTGTVPAFIDGPFVEAAYATLPAGNPAGAVGVSCSPFPYTGGFGGLLLTGNTNTTDPDLLSVSGAGRLEFWVRGDGLDINSTPGGSASLTGLVYWDHHNITGGAEVIAGIDKTRHPFVSLNDGAGHTTVLTSTHTIPTDAAWYFVGAAYDIPNKKLWVKYHTSTVETASASTLVTTNLPAVDYVLPADVSFTFVSWFPIAEVQVTAGAQANADNFPTWVNDTSYWDPSAAQVIMRPSQNRNLQVLAEPQPVRALDYLQKWAQAELAMTRCDEFDRYLYLPMRYWVETAQQTQVDTVTSVANLEDLQVTRDVTRIRNSVSLTYQQGRADTGMTIVYSDSSVVPLPPGDTVVTYQLQYPIFELSDAGGWGPTQNHGSFIPLDPTSTDPPTDASYFTANTKADGTGTYFAIGAATGLDAICYTWTPGTVTTVFTNSTSSTVYLANNKSVPTIAFAGKRAVFTNGSVTGKDPASITARGELGLTVSLQGIQDPAWAQLIANELAARFARPRWRAEQVKVVGDPRRQPGDLARLTDASNTALDGLGRVMSVQHQRQGAKYEQTLTLVQHWPVAIWDVSLWDQAIWGA